MAERPGIMVYFDLLETLNDFTTEEAGELFLAMLEYGSMGTLPEFEDRAMRTVWKSVQQKLDRDDAKYQNTCEARRYATFCREYRKEHGETSPLPSYEDWKNQMISNDDFDVQLGTITGTITGTETVTGEWNRKRVEGERENSISHREEEKQRLGFDW